jgi:hypothetical protein
MITVGIAVIVALGVAGLIYSQRQAANAPSSNNPRHLPGLMTGSPPWDANNGPQLRARLRALGLPALASEATVVHIHQHLDIYVKGHKIPVPPLIGIDENGTFLAPLHVHDASGVVHVESPSKRTYSLGEFFDVWGLKLTNNCIGGLCSHGSDDLKVFVNGKRVSDPTSLVLASHQEIVVTYGAKAELPNPIPAAYKFPAGE